MKVIPREHYLLAREHLAPHWRDGMDVQAGTGWHVTELIRFAQKGSVEPYRGDAEGVSGVLVCPQWCEISSRRGWRGMGFNPCRAGRDRQCPWKNGSD